MFKYLVEGAGIEPANMPIAFRIAQYLPRY